MSADAPECPTCDRDDFASERGMMNHHAKVHGERLSVVSLECSQCGGSFSRQRTTLTDSPNNFCSERCYGDYASENYAGENAGGWQGGKVTVSCTYCGEDTQKKPHEIKDRENNYCSKECWYDDYRGHSNGRDRREVDCSWCGDTMHRKPSELERYDNLFCSMDCRGKWQSQNVVGEAHPNWSGGEQCQAGFHQRLKEWIRRRDALSCQDCGIGNEVHLEQFGQSLEVHHIVPRRKFDDLTQAHKPGNLVTLCISCHRKWEQMAGLRPDPSG